MLREVVGRILKRYREEIGLTQREVAIRCQKTEMAISLLENGKRDPSFSFLFSYLRAVGKPFTKFASDLEGEEFKEEIKPVIEKDMPKETKKKVLKYAVGIRYFVPGVISFPEYLRERIKREISQMKEEKSLSDCLAFAEEYFQGLEKTRENRSNVDKLKEIQNKYKEKGLKLPLMIKVMQITGDAFRREVKRLAAQKPPQETRQKEMVERYARGEEIKDRVIKRVKEFLFQKKGMSYVWFNAYLRAAKEFFGRWRRKKGNLSEERIKEWEEKKIREGCDQEILEEITKIVSEELGKV